MKNHRLKGVIKIAAATAMAACGKHSSAAPDKFIWRSNLVLDNSVLVRYTVQ